MADPAAPLRAPAHGVVYGPHARRGPAPSAPPSSPAGSAGAWARPGARALLRGWRRALTPDAWVSVHETPHPATVAVMRWAPFAGPLVVGALTLALTLWLRAARGHALLSPLPAQAVIPALLLVIALGCVVQGLALYVAPNGVLWSLALLGGAPLLLTVALTLTFGAPGALLALAACAAPLLVYTLWRLVVIPPGEVAVTLLLGEWYRTLPAGYNITLPGERIIARLRTAPHAFTTELRRVNLGANRVAQARATVAYLVDAREAWRTASVRATWEQELRQRVGEALSASLLAGANAHSAGGPGGANGAIARGVLDETRGWARSVGVRILSVRAHDIAVGAPDELAALAQSAHAAHGVTASAEPQIRVEPVEPIAADPRLRARRAPAEEPEEPEEPDTPHPTGAPDRMPTYRPDAFPAPRPRATGQPLMVAPAAPRGSASAERPSPEALEDLYEAIRNRQITDTQVIRQIAAHFAAYAREGTAATSFDAASAAQLLGDYADALDLARPVARSRVRRSQD